MANDQQGQKHEERRRLKNGEWVHTIDGVEQDIPIVQADGRDKPEERKPLLSEAEIEKLWNNDMFELGQRRGTDGYVLPQDDELFEDGYRFGIKRATSFYESKITGGELMVVKTATIETDAMGLKCSSCNHYYSHGDQPAKGQFCRCGCKIIEP